MKRFFMGVLIGVLVGIGLGWLMFSKKGQRAVEREVEQIQHDVDKSLQEVDRKLN